ncbi:hypothetical protein M441DRAFT_41198 [Trichoderma asperellum CBS 433.97]|uniref:Zn(2)-C6 fungal-type domain-containing protein n=1 Tax=Trichoderma asperellum (strain ATCC 204424 / CBS 433.97 / NBRC 101777) TaxID=1042311 RepID=A0A2T3YSN5_TRIA4|nr:hypothetical protein M441DRAFT_41198 [Trichoderma asperellum CBS 433.97]PTB35580.1 hypothetical protein M441DRAFT_41198 [Trichoderma asperellum CBS 433.97]
MTTGTGDDVAEKPQTKLKRSRNGCINCRARRVKCDEKQPACGRCSSLGLPCHKPERPIPLKIRRRGHGPVKSRNILRWEPPKILPNIQQITPDRQPSSAVRTNSASIPQLDNSVNLDIVRSTADITDGARSLGFMEPISGSAGTDAAITSPGEEIANQLTAASVTAAGSIASPLRQAFDNSFSRMLDGLVENPNSHEEGNTFLAKPSFPAQSLIAEPTDVYLQPSWLNTSRSFNSGSLDTLTQPFYTYTEPLLPRRCLKEYFKLQQTATLLSPKMSYELADALNLNQIERKALDYYRSHFSCFRSIKGFLWSEYSIYLTAATNSNMILHLILAISLRGLSRDTQDASALQLSTAHLHKGLVLLQKQLEGQNSEIMEVMISFWFLALFTMESDSAIGRIQRHELSNKVYRYSRAYLLDEVCGPPNASMAMQSSKENSAARISMAMKILCMIANLDVQLNIFGYGGELSDFCYEKDQLNHGDEYPYCELAYDVESSECARVYQDQHRLYHWLNQLFWNGVGDYQSIEKDIEAHEEKYRSFFRIAHRDDIDDDGYSRLHFQIDAAVCEFYAIRLYHFRCQNEKLPDDKVQNWVSSYLQIAYRLQQSKVRYHWIDKSLFLVGSETRDAIHRDWIQRRMLREDLKRALKCVWQKEKMHGRRLSREEFQAVLRDEAGMHDPALTTIVQTAV